VSAFSDVPVACTKSGIIVLLVALLPEKDYEHAIEKLHRLDGKTTFVGRVCPVCYVQRFSIDPTGRTDQTCEYRPLRGPLFVPRS
jgi:hypothetical protein